MSWVLTALMFHVAAGPACGRSSGPDSDGAAGSEGPADVASSGAGDAAQASVRPRLGELRFVDLTPEAIRPEAIPALIGDLVKQAMEKDFERAESDPSACRASIEVGYTLLVNRQPVLSADAGEARALFEGELFCPTPGARPGSAEVDAFRLKLDTQRSFGGVSGGSARERLLEAVRAVIGDGAAGLFGQARMRHAPDAELRTTLATSDHLGLLAEAASEAGERHLIDVVPDLARLTAHPNLRVATRAGAALGLLKVATPEVIKALVRMTDGPEPEKHLIAIHALADLGTPEAKRYLESLALGHPSPALREVARARLRGMGVEPPAERAPDPVPESLPQ